MILGVPKSLAVRLSWTTVGYGFVLTLRLVNSVLLARLLAPQILGVMAIVNTLRVGIELLSDVGILQNIVSNPRGSEPDFYDTAWTLQALRGIALSLVCLAVAAPLSRFFNYPELAAILPVASLFFIFTGFDSTARGLIQKDLQVGRLAVFEILVTAVQVIAQVGIALITRTVWALVLGTVVGGAVTLIMSFLYIPGQRHRFMIDRTVARELMTFGKWIFLSSLVFFFAMNFDRLYFAKQISLAQLGVYGVARGLAEMCSAFIIRCSNSVLFPTIAAANLPPVQLRAKILRGRRTLLAAAAIAIGGFLALAPAIVSLLYDPRYREAAEIVQILCVGLWFSTLAQTNDSILLGLARPVYPALSNVAKLVAYCVGVPLAFHFSGFIAAVAVISGGELVKYVALWMLSHKEHLRFGRDDLMLTVIFAGTALLASEVAHSVGLPGDLPLLLRVVGL
ncbi:MAG TPA: oligosaccharide flippase family protein [Sphingomicrobium sp.]|nr:oligosaccharide flippase family protein [Sphingomicrobium sp.]